MTTARFIYVVGPSGAGKDSLLGWVAAHLPQGAPFHLARRTITRPAEAGGEQHEGVDREHFLRLRDAGAFAVEWEANRLCYGVRHRELAPRAAGRHVIVNGSRGHLSRVLQAFPELVLVHVTAPVDELRRRLSARNRETPAMVDARLARAVAFRVPPGVPAVEIANDGPLDQAGARLLAVLLAL